MEEISNNIDEKAKPKKSKPYYSSAKKRKSVFLEVLRKKAGNISEACKAINIDRKTYWHWRKKDPVFLEQCEEVQENLIDFAESKLLQGIQEGNTTLIIFFLKTKAKHRGYVENSELYKNKDIPIIVNFIDSEQNASDNIIIEQAEIIKND